MGNYKSIELNLASIRDNFDTDVKDLCDILNKDFLVSNNLKQGIVYNYDKVDISDIHNLDLDSENILEARFFNEDCELVLFNEDNEFTGYFIKEIDTNFVITETREIYSKAFSKLDVKKYIAFDEDNQAYIKYLKPCRLYK